MYVNGVRMSDADIIITSGDTVTFIEALADGDEVDIVAYGTFSVASLNADNLDSGTVPSARVSGAYTGITGVGTLTSFASTGIDDNASSTAITLDSSNNLLVGTTDNNPANNSSDTSADNGIVLSNDAKLMATRHNATPVFFNRTGDDGEIIELRKSGSPVGSIGVVSGDRLYIGGGGNNGIGIDQHLFPTDDDGILLDATMNLGASNARYQDLYVSGGVAFDTGTAANYLDDYEEGTFTPTLQSSGSESISTSSANGNYTKIGNVVNFRFEFININTSGTTSTNAVRMFGLPFTPDVEDVNFSVMFDNITLQGSRTGMVGYVNSTANHIFFAANGLVGGDASDTPVDCGDINSGVSDLFGSGFYYTNQ